MSKPVQIFAFIKTMAQANLATKETPNVKTGPVLLVFNQRCWSSTLPVWLLGVRKTRKHIMRNLDNSDSTPRTFTHMGLDEHAGSPRYILIHRVSKSFFRKVLPSVGNTLVMLLLCVIPRVIFKYFSKHWDVWPMPVTNCFGRKPTQNGENTQAPYKKAWSFDCWHCVQIS